MFINI